MIAISVATMRWRLVARPHPSGRVVVALSSWPRSDQLSMPTTPPTNTRRAQGSRASRNKEIRFRRRIHHPYPLLSLAVMCFHLEYFLYSPDPAWFPKQHHFHQVVAASTWCIRLPSSVCQLCWVSFQILVGRHLITQRQQTQAGDGVTRWIHHSLAWHDYVPERCVSRSKQLGVQYKDLF